MQQTFFDDAAQPLVATITGNTLSLFVPRHPHVERLKVPPAMKTKLGHAMKRPDDFHAFARVVDDIEG